jgi:hypothetical protein
LPKLQNCSGSKSLLKPTKTLRIAVFDFGFDSARMRLINAEFDDDAGVKALDLARFSQRTLAQSDCTDLSACKMHKIFIDFVIKEYRKQSRGVDLQEEGGRKCMIKIGDAVEAMMAKICTVLNDFTEKGSSGAMSAVHFYIESLHEGSDFDAKLSAVKMDFMMDSLKSALRKWLKTCVEKISLATTSDSDGDSDKDDKSEISEASDEKMSDAKLIGGGSGGGDGAPVDFVVVTGGCLGSLRFTEAEIMKAMNVKRSDILDVSHGSMFANVAGAAIQAQLVKQLIFDADQRIFKSFCHGFQPK